MTSLVHLALLLMAIVLFSISTAEASKKSNKPGTLCPTAVFTFSDSLSDTGNRDREAGGHSLSGTDPYGVTYGRPTGRYSDGLLIPDLLISKLRLENLAIPSLAYNGSEFVSLNFGYAGATVIQIQGSQPALSSPHILATQVQDFLRHQSTTIARYGRETSQPWYENALFYVEIGGDDINFGLPQGGNYTAEVIVPAVIKGLADAIATLYSAGARHVMLFNMPRADCAPTYLEGFGELYAPGAYHYDKDGCIVEVGELISFFNSGMEEMAAELQRNYTGLNVYYYDWFAANTEVIENMGSYGFTTNLQSCCGGGGKYNCDGGGLCGCGTANVSYTVCDDPAEYITFDGVHYTEHFYSVMTDFILAGQYLSPTVKLEKGCKVIPEPEGPL